MTSLSVKIVSSDCRAFRQAYADAVAQQTFEMALKDLVKNGLLSVETARSAMG